MEKNKKTPNYEKDDDVAYINLECRQTSIATANEEFNDFFKEIKNNKLDTIEDFKAMIKIYTH